MEIEEYFEVDCSKIIYQNLIDMAKAVFEINVRPELYTLEKRKAISDLTYLSRS